MDTITYSDADQQHLDGVRAGYGDARDPEDFRAGEPSPDEVGEWDDEAYGRT